MRLNRSYLIVFSIVLIPFYIRSKWNQPKVCTIENKELRQTKNFEETVDSKIYLNIKDDKDILFSLNNDSDTIQITSEERMETLNDICQYSLPLPLKFDQLSKKEKDILMKHVIVNDEYKFLYCYTPKVACSNWKKVIKYLYGQVDDVDKVYKMNHQSGFKKLSDYNVDEINFRISNYYKFMFVRNPTRRIISAYRNKFNEIEAFYKTYGKKINEIFHPKRLHQNYEGKVIGDDIAFLDFIKYLNEGVELIDMNEHWMPMSLLCQPCVMGYNFIGSTENIDEDSETVLRSIKAPSQVHFPKRQSYYKPTSKSLENFYLSLLPRNTLHEFVQRYSLDYNMFSYHKPYFVHESVVVP